MPVYIVIRMVRISAVIFLPLHRVQSELCLLVILFASVTLYSHLIIATSTVVKFTSKM